MVSAGLDTVPGNLIMGIAYLSTAHGQEIQERAYKEIMKIYPNGDAWERCLVEEKVPYLTAFVKEVLRFWSVIPICLPRVSTKDIEYKGAIIPAGTTFFMVSSSFRLELLKSYLLLILATIHRTLTPRTTTTPTSKTHTSFVLSATLTSLMVLAHHTTLTALAVACVPARILQTANSIRRFCA